MQWTLLEVSISIKAWSWRTRRNWWPCRCLSTRLTWCKCKGKQSTLCKRHLITTRKASVVQTMSQIWTNRCNNNLKLPQAQEKNYRKLLVRSLKSPTEATQVLLLRHRQVFTKFTDLSSVSSCLSSKVSTSISWTGCWRNAKKWLCFWCDAEISRQRCLQQCKSRRRTRKRPLKPSERLTKDS